MRVPTARKLASIAGAALAMLVLGVFGVSELRLERTYTAPREPVTLRADPRTLARGRLVGEAIAQCGFCHGDDLGGKPVADDRWVGRLFAPNLTAGRGGLSGDYRNEDLARAIRDGLSRDGHSLRLMPSDHFRAMSDEDLAAVIAWVRSAPPVDREGPSFVAGPLTRLVLGLGLAPELLAAERIDHASPPPPAPPPGETPAYGAYLVGIGICRVCHHDDLRGGLHPLALPGEPPPSDLTSGGPLAGWSGDDFLRALRSGTTPDGRAIDAEYMPWPRYAQMGDTELRAIWMYLQTVP